MAKFVGDGAGAQAAGADGPEDPVGGGVVVCSDRRADFVVDDREQAGGDAAGAEGQ